MDESSRLLKHPRTSQTARSKIVTASWCASIATSADRCCSCRAAAAADGGCSGTSGWVSPGSGSGTAKSSAICRHRLAAAGSSGTLSAFPSSVTPPPPSSSDQEASTWQGLQVRASTGRGFSRTDNRSNDVAAQASPLTCSIGESRCVGVRERSAPVFGCSRTGAGSAISIRMFALIPLRPLPSAHSPPAHLRSVRWS
jgi:hypothetical protein